MGKPSRRAALGALLAAAVFSMHASLFLGGLVDDAYIAFRYARNLAHGLGLVFNPGERVEGFTSFSWVLASAASVRAGLAPELTMPLVGALSGAALVWVVVRAGARFADDGDPRAGLLSGLLLAMAPGVAFYAVSGLEHTFFTLLLTLAALALVERRLVAWALWTSAAFVTRPEAALLGPLGLALVLGTRRDDGTRPWRTLALPIALFALCLAPYLGAKLWYFGDLVPNTLRAKTPDTYLAAHYTLMGSLPGLALAALTVHAWRRGTLTRPQRELFVIGCAYVLSIVAVGPDWMPAFRFFVPPLPCLLLAAGPALVACTRTPRRPVAVLVALVAVALYAVPSVQKTLGLSVSTERMAARDEAAARLAHQLAQAGVQRVATINIGMLAYAAPDLVFTDLAGLVDREIGRGPGKHLAKHPSDAYLLARDPDVYVLTSSEPPVTADGRGRYVPDREVERYVFTRPWFLARYGFAGSTQISAVDYYALFQRRR